MSVTHNLARKGNRGFWIFGSCIPVFILCMTTLPPALQGEDRSPKDFFQDEGVTPSGSGSSKMTVDQIMRYQKRVQEKKAAKKSQIKKSDDVASMAEELKNKASPLTEKVSAQIVDLKAATGQYGGVNASPKERPGLAIENIGLIVNAYEGQHFTRVIKEYMRVMTDHDLAAGRLYILGRSKAVMNNGGIILTTIARGGQVGFRENPPRKYDVKMSPAWLVNTEKGQIILEGFTSLTAFFNEKGEFVDPPPETTAGNASTGEAAKALKEKILSGKEVPVPQGQKHNLPIGIGKF